MGHEGQGVSPALEARAAHHVRIAQPGGEESLNVAAAAAICLHASAAGASCERLPAIIKGFPAHTPPSAHASQLLDESRSPKSDLGFALGVIHPEIPVLLSLKGNFPPAILALADGTVFLGNSIGATGATTGEVVFNTAMTGYQEILTDPSYCQQIVTLTYPHIGNYGVNEEDIEADKIHAAGLIIKDLPLVASNFRKTATLSEYLVRRQDGRHRQHRHAQAHPPSAHQGAQNGCILGLAEGETVTPGVDRQGRRRRQGRAEHGGPGPRQGRVGQGNLRMDADRVEARRGLRRADHAQVPRRRLRLRRQEEHPAHDRPARRAHHGRAGADARGRRAEAEARRHLPGQRPRRPGALRLRDRGRRAS